MFTDLFQATDLVTRVFVAELLGKFEVTLVLSMYSIEGFSFFDLITEFF